MNVQFDFSEHDESRRNWFMFGDDLTRRVPIEMDEIEGLNTIGMYVEEANTFHKGESCVVNCVVIAPELFKPNIKVGSKGRLWDGGFFATTEVTEVFSQGWPNDL